MSKEVVAEVIALIELGLIAPEDIVKCLRKANSEPETALAEQPAQRTWVGLTDEQAVGLYKATETDNRMVLIDAVEAKLKEKNT